MPDFDDAQLQDYFKRPDFDIKLLSDSEKQRLLKLTEPKAEPPVSPIAPPTLASSHSKPSSIVSPIPMEEKDTWKSGVKGGWGNVNPLTPIKAISRAMVPQVV